MKLAVTLVLSLLLAPAFSASAQEKSANDAGVELPQSSILLAQATPPAATPAPSAPGATPTTPPPAPVASRDPAEFARIFFGLLEKNEIDAAYLSLTRGSKIAERPEELRALKTKTREAIDVFGAIRGYDLVERKLVGERLLRATYLSLGKEFPLRWRFYFYKADDTWRLIDLRVDDKLTGIFEEPEEPKATEKP